MTDRVDPYSDTSQVPVSAFPHSTRSAFHLHLPFHHFPHPSHPHAHKPTTFSGYGGTTVAPLSHRIGTTGAALSETFEVLLKDGGERGWWTLSDLAHGELPWWRLKQKNKDCNHRGKEKKPPKHHRLPTRYPGYNTLPPTAPVLMMGGYRGSVLETVPVDVDPRTKSRSSSLKPSASEADLARVESPPSGVQTDGSPRSSSELSRGDTSLGRISTDLNAEAEADSDNDDASSMMASKSGGSLSGDFKHGCALFGHRAFPAFRKAKDPSQANSHPPGSHPNTMSPSPSSPTLPSSPSETHSLASSTGSTSSKPEKIWPNMKAAMFHPGHPDLAMLLMEEKEDEGREPGQGPQEVVEAANGVRATHMANTIGGIVNLGWGLRRRLERMNRDRRIGCLSRWGYDFRSSLPRSSSLLIVKLTRLRDASPTKSGATVFAHSMGGLVVLHALATCEDPKVFGRVVFFGTPFQGCGGIMGPLRDGDGLLRQQAICDAVTTGSWPSSFNLLPTKPPFVDPKGEAVPLDLYDVANWDTWALCPLADGINEAMAKAEDQTLSSSPIQSPDAEAFSKLSMAAQATRPAVPSTSSKDRKRSDTASSTAASPRSPRSPTKSKTTDSHRTSHDIEAYLASKGPYHPVNATPQTVHSHFRRVLDTTLSFRHDIIASYSETKASRGEYPPMAIVASRSRPTVRGAMISEPTAEALVREGHEDMIFEWGDEVVTWEAATHVPGPWGRHIVKIVESNFGHLALMADNSAISDALLALDGEIKKRDQKKAS